LRRTSDDEERFPVLLELGTLVGLESILDGKFMQTELGLELSQKSEARLVQADPDHVPRAPRPLTGILDGDLGHSPAAEIGCRGDNTRGQRWSRGRRNRLVHAQG
jgi:hypothetical protein